MELLSASSCIERIGGAWTSNSLSRRASEVMASSRRVGTLTSYRLAWNQWVDWCIKQHDHPTFYIAHLVDKGLEFNREQFTCIDLVFLLLKRGRTVPQ